ncbi:methyltransferase domain-containing protein [Oscillatoriales cyanobacterium LEGE 11467]|uniref:Methyltransferase domain-containing protein n=1 Tax=Zarconia navalis LEGE 11467 TaxID=1828826 RepID=A0A928VXH5_9CYAN|nr:class I SAM-dependent methyltransferase [Zarconia navalis]MBE9039590.1 methyltransferase domain-containing protein [Zarconia navalis LEGE 11467]
MHQYTSIFFQEIQKYSYESACEIVPLVLEVVNCNTIVDVGCGDGTWLKAFQEHGVEDILGIDGDYVTPNILAIPKDNFSSFDLTKKLTLNRKFDLVISLEVAEHLPSEFANTFIDSLTDLGSCILFSAAIPYQPGENHINCQWQDYWVELFKKRGYVAIDCIRPKTWENQKVAYWFSQNILMFVKLDDLDISSRLYKEYELTRENPISMVHPRLYSNTVGQLAKYTVPENMSLKKAWKTFKIALSHAIFRKINSFQMKGYKI